MIAVMRFLTRERFGFRVRGIDAQTLGGRPRCTRWSRTYHHGNVSVIVDHQHTTTLGPPYWQARVRCRNLGLQLQTGPDLVTRNRMGAVAWLRRRR